MKLTISQIDSAQFTIVEGKSHYAAENLRHYIALATGNELPIDSKSVANRHEIRIGLPKTVCSRLKLTTDAESAVYSSKTIENETYSIKCALGNLLIQAGSEEGEIAGVFDFIEMFCKISFVHAETDYIGRTETQDAVEINIPDKYSYKHVPVFEYRQLDWKCSYPEDWRAKNHVNFASFHWVEFVHTLASLAETNDPRSQPCLSDPAVLKTVIKNVRKKLDENPDCKIISVSQNDNFNYCKCEKCAAVDEEEGSHAGTLLRFVNAVADAIKDDYPDVSVDTLAYQYTRKPPMITKPRDNVIIRLCSIECCFSHALDDADCGVNAEFHRDIVEWGKIAKRIYIWDYVTDFSYYVTPFPNFRVLRQNMAFFADNNVVGMYPEGNYNSISGEFGEMRAYLLAKLMWNPYMSEDEYARHAAVFLDGYYGAASAYVKKFVKFIDEQSRGRHMSIWQNPLDVIPREVYEANEGLIDSWWNDGMSAIAESGEDVKLYLDRLEKSRLCWDAVKLMMKPSEAAGRAFYAKSQKYGVKWNEWCSYKPEDEIDFALPPTEWIH